jgi:hypothetical protein
MSLFRSIVLTLVLTALAAGVGVWGGATYVQRQMRRTPALHELVHERLHLTADQARSIEALEQDHAVKQAAPATSSVLAGLNGRSLPQPLKAP